MATYNKSGVVRYYVTTDTHHTPWGYRNGVNGKTIHFDLGDNTAGCEYDEFDPPEDMDTETGIALDGNHDTAVVGGARKGLQIYRDTTHKIIFFGLDTGTDDLDIFQIPDSQVNQMAAAMEGLADNWDVAVLTHMPLFPGRKGGSSGPVGAWNCGACWSAAESTIENIAQKVFDLLTAFSTRGTYTDEAANKTYNFSSKNGYVIGCFAGHIHAHVKCTYKGFPMEAFTTNGADEWTYDQGYSNTGLYIPYENYINVNFDSKTVNGMSYANPEANYFQQYDSYHNEANCYYMDKASCNFKMQPDTTAHPKFYDGAYIGYSYSTLDGTSFGKNTRHDRYWPFNTNVTLSIGGRSVSACSIWFDTRGRLRYYAPNPPSSDYKSYEEIENYDNVRVTFKANNVQWTFQDGLLVSAIPTYRSGTLKAKYNWGIVFNASGVPVGINENGGAAEDFGAGQNYVNVTNIKVYDGKTLKEITNMPQIGITGTFNSNSKINLARADYGGSNQISSPDNLLIRVVGDDGAVMWLYDGKLTSLTDQQVL